MFKVSKPPPDARILKIREYEDKLARMQSAVKEGQHFEAVASWENKSDAKVKQIDIQRRIGALKAQRAADLDARRERLFRKLWQEEAQLKEELINSIEKPEERRAKLAQRARELKAAREAERQTLARELQERAFREGCDPLRGKLSKQTLFMTLDERRQQIMEKMSTRILEEDEKRIAFEMNEAERIRKERRYADDRRLIQEHNLETKRLLELQVQDAEERRRKEAEQMAQERAEMLATWRKMDADADAAELARQEHLRKIAEDVKVFNADKLAQTQAIEKANKDLEKMYLMEALAKEEADEAREREAKERRKMETLKYNEHLKLMMQKEEVDTAERDAMIEAARKAQEAKKDAEMAAREAARKRLMNEVDAVRQQQIADKLAARHAELEADLQARLMLEEELQHLSVQEQQKAMATRRRLLEQRLDVEVQMVARQHMAAAEKAEAYVDAEMARQQEAEYSNKIQQALQEEPVKWHGRRKVEWYH